MSIDTVALGMGAYGAEDARQLLDRLRSIANPAATVVKPTALPSDLAAAGIGYRIVPATSGGDDV